MKKTLTVRGRQYTALQIAELMDNSYYDHICGTHIILNGVGYYAEYRNDDGYYAPMCSRSEANSIRLVKGSAGLVPHGKRPIWIDLK